MIVATATVARRGRRPLRCEPLRELRHTSARAAREATVWLSELEFARKSPRTITAYSGYVDALCGRYPDHALADFTPDDITAFITSYPESSRPIVKSALNGWFRWARLHGRVDANPVELVADIKPREQTLVDVFSEADVAGLCGLPEPDGVLQRLLFSTGVRKEEACALQVKHVSFEDRHIAIFKGKGRRDRLVPLPPVLAGRLDHWFTTDGMDRDDFLWYSRPGGQWRDHRQHIASTTFYRWWKRCLEDAGVEYRKPHTTRHTFATRAIRAGVDVDKVRRILGHKNIATTVQTYIHMTVEDMHDDLALLETF